MRRTDRKELYFEIIERVWNRQGRVSYKDFCEALIWARAHMSPDRRAQIHIPSQPTFSRYWRLFKKQQRIRSCSTAFIRDELVREMTEESIDPELPWNDLLASIHGWARERRVALPAPRRLDILIRSARAQAVGRRRRAQQAQREEALGIVLHDLPLVRRFTAAQELVRYPPAWQGKANLKTMAREACIMSELEHVLATNRLQPEALLANAITQDALNLIESTPPSLLSRIEKQEVVAALPIYLASRWQQARDVVITCFVRKARSLRFKVNELHDQAVREHSLSLLEDSGPRLRALRRAVLQAIDQNDPSILRDHRHFLAHLEDRQEEITSGEGLFSILAGRGNYARKFAHRLQGIPFEGHDPNAQAIVECLPELFAFHPFRLRAPWPVVNNLRFLDVPPTVLRRRRVFEPILLMTLADLIATGRITIPNSTLYRDIWTDVASIPVPEPPTDDWIVSLRQRLDTAWRRFTEVSQERNLVVDGKLHVPRVRAEEMEERRSIRLPSCSIVDILWEVHDATGFLDCFQLAGPAPHHLRDEERRRLTLAVLLAMGMNLGLREAARSFGRGYSLGRLRNVAAHYIRPETLRAALDRLLRVWDARDLGASWGTGQQCSVDGRVVYSYEKNLLSQYHHRKGRVGVTVYWFVRDDWMAAAIRLIGNQEYEAWYILDELLRPSGGKILESSCGDTHGQQLSLWGLSFLVGKRLLARFRGLRRVMLYGDRQDRGPPIRGVRTIRWNLISQCTASLQRLAQAVIEGKLPASDVLRTWNLYDDEGRNVGEALRELGKVLRTEYVLTYAMDGDLRAMVQRACTRSETWNSFQEAIAWGGGGRISTNNPRHREENGLSMAILMNAIVFNNAWRYGDRLKKMKGMTPIQWRHVRLYGQYHLGRRRGKRDLSEKRCAKSE